MSDVVAETSGDPYHAGLRCAHGVDRPDVDDREPITTRPSGKEVCTTCGGPIEAVRETRVRP